MRLRHIFILLLIFVLVFTASSCFSRVMYEDGQFDSTDMLENADDIFLLNSEINQDDDFHDDAPPTSEHLESSMTVAIY